MSIDPRKIDWSNVNDLLAQLYNVTAQLEELFPGRSFSPDGHLVGSIGEVCAAHMFDIELLTASTKGHDAKTREGKLLVEIKLTQKAVIAMRHQPDHLIALCRPKGGPLRVVYNGPGYEPWNRARPPQTNGQRTISLSTLTTLNADVPDDQRIPLVNPPPI